MALHAPDVSHGAPAHCLVAVAVAAALPRGAVHAGGAHRRVGHQTASARHRRGHPGVDRDRDGGRAAVVHLRSPARRPRRHWADRPPVDPADHRRVGAGADQRPRRRRRSSPSAVGIFTVATRIAAIPVYFADGSSPAGSARTQPDRARPQGPQGHRPFAASVTLFFLGLVGMVVCVSLAADVLVTIAPPSYASAAALIPIIALGATAPTRSFAGLPRVSFPRRRHWFILLHFIWLAPFSAAVVAFSSLGGVRGRAGQPGGRRRRVDDVRRPRPPQRRGVDPVRRGRLGATLLAGAVRGRRRRIVSVSGVAAIVLADSWRSRGVPGCRLVAIGALTPDQVRIGFSISRRSSPGAGDAATSRPPVQRTRTRSAGGRGGPADPRDRDRRQSASTSRPRRRLPHPDQDPGQADPLRQRPVLRRRPRPGAHPLPDPGTRRPHGGP